MKQPPATEKIAERPSLRLEQLRRELRGASSPSRYPGLISTDEALFRVAQVELRLDAIERYLDERWERSQRRGKKS